MDEAETNAANAGTAAAPVPGAPAERAGGSGNNQQASNTGNSDIRSMAGDAARQAGAAASEATQRVKETARQAGETVKEQGRTFLNDQKERVSSEIEAYSEAARRAAERLESESDTNLSGYVSSAADQLDRLAARVRERNLGELVEDVEGMARRRPEIFYGGMFVAGLAAARFLKATKEKQNRKRYQTSGRESRDRFSDGTRRSSSGSNFAASPAPAPAPSPTGSEIAPQPTEMTGSAVGQFGTGGNI